MLSFKQDIDRNKSFIQAAIAAAVLLLCTPQSHAGEDLGQALLDGIFKRTPGAELPIPQEVMESMHVAVALGHVKAINLFPYGQNQIGYVKNSGIQSATVNFRQIDNLGNINPIVERTLVIRFSRDGLVERMEHFWGSKKSQTDTYEYKDGVIAAMKAVDERGGTAIPGGQSGIEILLSFGENINYIAYQFFPSTKNIFREVSLDKRMRLITTNVPNLFKLDFRYDQAGSLNRIVEQRQLRGTFHPTSTIEYSVDYDGLHPKTSKRESVVSEDHPAFHKFNPNPFVFQIENNRVSQHRVTRNHATGEVTTTEGINYSFSNNRVQSVGQSWQQDEDIWRIAYDKDEVIHVARSAGPVEGGFRISGANGRVDEIMYGGPVFWFRGLLSKFILSGTVKLKYNPSTERPYRAEYIPRDLNKRYSATIDTELTTYYEK